MKNFGPDWNRNGKTDTFDHLMTLEMMNNIETEPVESRPKEKKNPPPEFTWVAKRFMMPKKTATV